MQHKKKILLRINILYIIFFCVIIGAFLSTVLSKDFTEGFKEGYEQGRKQSASHNIYALPLLRTANSYNLPIYAAPDSSISITGRFSAIDLHIEENADSEADSTKWASILKSISIYCYGAVFVIIFIMLASLRKCILKGNLFNRNNIKLTRAIGILLLVSSFLYNISCYLENHPIMTRLMDTPWKLSTDWYDFQDLIMGLLILVIAEIFAIGYDITEEQKLTI